MKAGAFAMESATYQTAALMDSGDGDYMVETAMLKVFATEVVWEIINDTIQLFGGKGYFTDEPFERLSSCRRCQYHTRVPAVCCKPDGDVVAVRAGPLGW